MRGYVAKWRQSREAPAAVVALAIAQKARSRPHLHNAAGKKRAATLSRDPVNYASRYFSTGAHARDGPLNRSAESPRGVNNERRLVGLPNIPAAHSRGDFLRGAKFAI